jgi:hypothetical protein
MSAKDDPTSLGNVLVELGLITPKQLADAVERQENSTIEQLLGAVLVHQGYCSKHDIETAMSAQKGLRKGKKINQALAMADLAIQRKRSNGARDRAIESGARFTRSTTGTTYPAVTAEMLAKIGNGG